MPSAAVKHPVGHPPSTPAFSRSDAQPWIRSVVYPKTTAPREQRSLKASALHVARVCPSCPSPKPSALWLNNSCRPFCLSAKPPALSPMAQ
eukprot:359925-Chlamydomonas_euryale.AAC.5